MRAIEDGDVDDYERHTAHETDESPHGIVIEDEDEWQEHKYRIAFHFPDQMENGKGEQNDVHDVIDQICEFDIRKERQAAEPYVKCIGYFEQADCTVVQRIDSIIIPHSSDNSGHGKVQGQVNEWEAPWPEQNNNKINDRYGE